MKILLGQEEKDAWEWIRSAVDVAKNATCARAKCGAIIVKDGKIIGEGFNSPPNNLESQCRCGNDKKSYNPKVTDKTCCIHAEQRAVFDALARNPDALKGSRLYFIRLDDDDQPAHAGQPYCTICSKTALDVGITEFILWKEEGICVYETEEYNDMSYQCKS